MTALDGMLQGSGLNCCRTQSGWDMPHRVQGTQRCSGPHLLHEPSLPSRPSSGCMMGLRQGFFICGLRQVLHCPHLMSPALTPLPADCSTGAPAVMQPGIGLTLVLAKIIGFKDEKKLGQAGQC